MQLPLNALRAFEVSARHLNFTRAALELHVTQTAVSQHVKNLEARIGAPLFRRLPRGAVFDSSLTMAEAVAQGAGVALLPVTMFSREVRQGRLVQPFGIATENGGYWLTRLKSKPEGVAMRAFRGWLLEAART